MNEQVNTSPDMSQKKAHVIITGNEKGGSGKTTTCMHLIIALMKLGFSVGSIDIDSRQRSLTRYIENRRQTISKEGYDIPFPDHAVVHKSPFNLVEDAETDEAERFVKAMSEIIFSKDFVVIDTPGNDTYLSRLVHSFADTVITPINDSFLDLDVLATVDGKSFKIIKPSIYSEMVWEQKLSRAKRDGGSIEWIVMRNRLSSLDACNKRRMYKVLFDLSRRLGFRVAPGFCERVIYREMFLQGLTVLDVMDVDTGKNISMSHITARQEVRDLLNTLQIPEIEARASRLSESPKTPEKEASPEPKAEVAAEAEDDSEDDVTVPALESFAESTQEETAITATVVNG